MLLDTHKNIKIVDFGLSNTYSQVPKKKNSDILVQVDISEDLKEHSEQTIKTEEQTLVKEELKTACGSPCYAAPEMIAGKRYKGKGVDIWSSGVVLYAMICGYLPFEDPETAKLYKKIMRADYEIPEWLSDAAVDMLA